MALPARQQLKYWSIAAAVLLALLWVFGTVLTPFILGMAISYLLDPLADRLERHGLSRVASVVLITVLGLFVFAAGVLLVIPTLIGQATALFAAMPEISRNIGEWLVTRFPDLTDRTSTVRQSLEELAEVLRARGGDLLQAALGSVSSLFGLVTLVVITPVVTFYLLLDWDDMVARIDALLPRDHAPTVRRLAAEVDATLAGFLRGQGTVCLILGIYYSAALMLAGLDFGLVVGAIAGLLTFIPYVGALVGGALAIGLALFQFWGEWGMIALVAAIFFSGQMAEGNYLTPKLVGSSVGLHPVWLLLALSAFGSVFGFVGMLVAVPVAAVIGVFVRFLIGEYLRGRLYRGLHYAEDAMEDVALTTHDARPLKRSDRPRAG